MSSRVACSHTALSDSPARTREMASSEDVQISIMPSAGALASIRVRQDPAGKRRLRSVG